MTYQYLSDCHNHSHFSADATDNLDVLCEKAIEIGLYAYTLTDHCECNDYDGRLMGYAYEKHSRDAFAAMSEKQKELAGRLRFYRGVELGQPMQNLAAAEDVLARDYDFVLGSVHSLKNQQDFYYMDYSVMSDAQIDENLHAYFDEMIEMIRWGGFDSLSHLTYPLRYIVGEGGRKVDIGRYQDRIRTIFSLLIENGKALEVNTSGLRQKIGVTLPDLPLLKQYYEMGGRLVTLGSDAHSADALGKGLEAGFDLLKQVGFTEFALYEKRKPLLLPLA